MPYAQRNQTGKIVGIFAMPQPHLGATEKVPDGTQCDSPIVQLEQARAAAAALWRGLPVATRAKYGMLYTTIADALNRGDVEAALYLLNAAPADAEEAALKAQFLELFV